MTDYSQEQNLRLSQKMLEQQGEINILKHKLVRIKEFLGYYSPEDQYGDDVHEQIAKAIVGIIDGEEVA